MVGEWAPPSMWARPSITTGAKKPGMAQDAATASGRGGRRSRPKTTRRPSSRRTAQMRSAAVGHSWPKTSPKASEMMSVLTEPSGSSDMATDQAERRGDGGRPAPGCPPPHRLSAARRSEERPGIVARPPPARSTSACPAGTAVGRARRRGGRGPRARRAASLPVMDPAEVPTTTSADRGSQPVTSASAPSTPAWNAPPATPPAPSTSPTRTAPSPIPRRYLPGRRRQVDWRTFRLSTASRYSSTRRWMTAAVFSTDSSWPTTWPTGLNCTLPALSA